METDSEISHALLPPCDENATELKNVYKVKDVIPKDVLELLYEPAKELLQKGSFGEKYEKLPKSLTCI